MWIGKSCWIAQYDQRSFFVMVKSPVDLDIGPDDRTLAFTADVSASKGYHFRWVDKGHEFEFIPVHDTSCRSRADQAPRVELTSAGPPIW